MYPVFCEHIGFTKKNVRWVGRLLLFVLVRPLIWVLLPNDEMDYGPIWASRIALSAFFSVVALVSTIHSLGNYSALQVTGARFLLIAAGIKFFLAVVPWLIAKAYVFGVTTWASTPEDRRKEKPKRGMQLVDEDQPQEIEDELTYKTIESEK